VWPLSALAPGRANAANLHERWGGACPEPCRGQTVPIEERALCTQEKGDWTTDAHGGSLVCLRRTVLERPVCACDSAGQTAGTTTSARTSR
jgi:hypothetical protein